jgi:hypothetical protein
MANSPPTDHSVSRIGRGARFRPRYIPHGVPDRPPQGDRRKTLTSSRSTARALKVHAREWRRRRPVIHAERAGVDPGFVVRCTSQRPGSSLLPLRSTVRIRPSRGETCSRLFEAAERSLGNMATVGRWSQRPDAGRVGRPGRELVDPESIGCDAAHPWKTASACTGSWTRTRLPPISSVSR